MKTREEFLAWYKARRDAIGNVTNFESYWQAYLEGAKDAEIERACAELTPDEIATLREAATTIDWCGKTVHSEFLVDKLRAIANRHDGKRGG